MRRAPACGGAELAAGLAQLRAERVVELGGKRSGAHARGVGLGDAPDVVERAGTHARARPRRAGDRVRRGHERIGAVVDVEQSALGTLEHHEAALVEHAPRDRRRVGDEGLEPVPVGPVLLGHRVKVELRQLRVRPQHQALGLHRRVDLLAQDVLVEEVLHADAESSRLVRVAGADAAPGGADLGFPSFASPSWSISLWYGMIRCALAETRRPLRSIRRRRSSSISARSTRDRSPCRCRSRTACRGGGCPTGPGGARTSRRRGRSCDRRCCRPVADHEVGLLGEQVDDLALALVAPLGADDYHTWHGESECWPVRR